MDCSSTQLIRCGSRLMPSEAEARFMGLPMNIRIADASKYKQHGGSRLEHFDVLFRDPNLPAKVAIRRQCDFAFQLCVMPAKGNSWQILCRTHNLLHVVEFFNPSSRPPTIFESANDVSAYKGFDSLF